MELPCNQPGSFISWRPCCCSASSGGRCCSLPSAIAGAGSRSHRFCRRADLGHPSVADRVGDIYRPAGRVTGRVVLSLDAVLLHPRRGIVAGYVVVCRFGRGRLPAGDGQQGGHGICAVDGALYDRTFVAGSFREAWRRRYGLVSGLGRQLACCWHGWWSQPATAGDGRLRHRGSVAGRISARSSWRFSTT